jgi:predicted aspartyl protease
MGRPVRELGERGGRFEVLVVLVVLVGLGVSGTSCQPHQSGWPPPVFPAAASPTVLAIRDPLRFPELSVDAHVTGTNARQAPIWMLVDSGASEVFLPAKLSESLGLPKLGRVRPLVFGPTKTTGMTVARVPVLALGDLAVRQLLVGAIEGNPLAVGGILGESVLRHAPWEISWDRGTLTLGARYWADEPGVTPLPLHRMERYPTDEIEVCVNGQPVKMLLDTGASASALPEDVATSLGLSYEQVPALPLFVGMGGAINVSRLYTGRLEIGGTQIAEQAFIGLPAHRPAVLGIDVLSRFDLLVVPGQRALLRARGDLRTTAAARIGRWAWIPKTCVSAGCLQARIDAEEMTLTLEAKLPGAVELLLGCAAPAAASPFQPVDVREALRGLGGMLDLLARRPPRPEAVTRSPSPEPQFRHLVVRMFGIEAGPRTVTAKRVGERWFSPAGPGCSELEVLDVVPLPGAADRDPTVVVRLAH